MLQRAASNPRIARQLLILLHLLADVDSQALSFLRQALLKPRFERKTVVLTGALATGSILGTTFSLSKTSPEFKEALAAPFAAPFERLVDELDDSAPWLTAYPKVSIAALSSCCGVAAWVYSRSRRLHALERADLVQAPIRVVKHRPVGEIASLLNATFSPGDSAELIRSLCLGISAH
jgi:hypothetical protein